jgi:hypothetical protein
VSVLKCPATPVDRLSPPSCHLEPVWRGCQALELATACFVTVNGLTLTGLRRMIAWHDRCRRSVRCLAAEQRVWFTSTEVVYGVTGTGVTKLPGYGVSP